MAVREDVALEDMTYEEVEDTVAELTERVMEIDAQLAQRRSESTSYDPEIRAAYAEWRSRAVAAKNYTVADLTAAKNIRNIMRRRFSDQMKEARERSTNEAARQREAIVPGVDAESPAQLLARVLCILHESLDVSAMPLADVDKVVMKVAHRIVERELGQSATAYVVSHR